MKVLSNKVISFAARIKQEWTKEHQLTHYNLNEQKYNPTLAEVRRIEEKEGNILPTPPSEDQSYPIIQLYSPDKWHDSQAIIVNENGRKKLIDALQSGAKKIVIPAFVSDGEGFELYIQILPGEAIGKIWLPYIDNMCHGDDGGKPDPKYPVTQEEEHKLIDEGKDAGEWKVIL